MKLQLLTVPVLAMSMSSIASAQQTSGVVYDMFTRTVASRFDAGDQPRGAVWTSTSAGIAFVTNPQALLRINILNPGFPVIAGHAAPLSFPLGGNGVPGPIAVNRNSTRAYIAGVLLNGMSGAGIYDTTNTSDPVFMTVVTPSVTTTITGAAIGPRGQTAVFPGGGSLFFADLTTDPAYTSTPTYPFLSRAGAPLNGVNAVFTDNATIAVSLADGGMQLVNFSTFPPTPKGDALRPDGCTASSAIVFIPLRLSGDHMVALICSGTPSEVVFVDVEGGTPAILSSVVLPAQFNNAQAIAINMLNGNVYVASSQSIGTIPEPWSSLEMSSVINLSPQMQIPASGLAVSPDGQHLMVVGQPLP